VNCVYHLNLNQYVVENIVSNDEESIATLMQVTTSVDMAYCLLH